MRYNIALVLVFLAGFYYSCCKKETIKKPDITKANLYKTTWSKLDGFFQDDIDLAFEVFKKDCQKSIRYDSLKEVCQEAFKATDSKAFFTQNFTPYGLMTEEKKETGLITGYYEPLLNGSLTQNQKFKYPIYKTPSNLLTIDLSEVYPELKKYRLRGKLEGNKVVAYSSREDLEEKEASHLEPICFVDNKIDLFFLQIQGSGKVKLQDGTILNIGYAQQNGRAYYSIGRKLIEIGAIKKEDISLQSIKEWLEENPSKIDEILNLNDSYVFFHNSSKSATGSLGTQLTPFRNLAVDRSFIPLGFPVFINTFNPLTKKPINQLMVAADTGGAIKGDIRADFFFGNGKEAELLAGTMKEKGKLFILIPNKLN